MAAATSTYAGMVRAIRGGHTAGNRVRMLKLPLVLTDAKLYFGAIAQFYWLTRALEDALAAAPKADAGVRRVRGLELEGLSAKYEADLAALGGDGWRREAEARRTAETAAYCKELADASPTELCAAAFILWGALVVGGGRATQMKVRRVFPGAEHVLFDVADDMKVARRRFRECFDACGEEGGPGARAELERCAAHFMSRNNSVILSIRCLPFWWWRVVCAVAAAALAVAATLLVRS